MNMVTMLARSRGASASPAPLRLWLSAQSPRSCRFPCGFIFELPSAVTMHGSYFTAGLHGLHDEATPSEILAAFKSLKRRRWAIEVKRMQVALSLNMTHDFERKRKAGMADDMVYPSRCDADPPQRHP
ncbi:hypothetical protein H310_09581 [Aphanomyces invadans]|uniref:Uncharacterized protein n=1 Tax=Aphanomyces invadans TaxID=157072 RepID=A0A024TVP2_9STRA|nr:hypothetical protein H310_09581 [Aphanomyces invadans]ETV97696.1 hypothetical protein H310_09581 [Aphanomyces invadans]|eukprot:XP_008873905.1 hypothetical protein H310_09581 [Aphanomyces invadans]